MNKLPFYELQLPDLVNDVRKIFNSHLYPNAKPDFDLDSVLRVCFPKPGEPGFEEMDAIVKKYPFLMRHAVVWRLPENYKTTIRLDGIDNSRRKAACSILIDSEPDSIKTEFYKVNPEDFYIQQEIRARLIIDNSPAEKVGEFTLKDLPVITNTQCPLQDCNYGSTPAFLISWTVNIEWDWDTVVNNVEKYINTK